MSSPTQDQINQVLDSLADAAVELADATMYDCSYSIDCFVMGIGGQAGYQAATLPAHDAWLRRHKLATPGPHLHPIIHVEHAFRTALGFVTEASLALGRMGEADENIWGERRLALEAIQESLLRRAERGFGIVIGVPLAGTTAV
ncbi:hypothetical protein B0A48_03208 [Cryoendolithus antarcticus]|uniref:Uncharacterized protein n=1 Tax=Cryoendolithus antarcticus TaxID=1507870 RepID=A0A1V8TJQ9_9PEZI|nr:hypothetical protein B0A48_03208 [Cryoendolithus antarcticus]